MKKWFPVILTAVMAAWFLGTLRPPADKGFAFSEFGKLPVLFNGRMQPMDSLARNSLLQIREKQTLNTEPWKDWNEHPRTISAVEWLANVMMNPSVANQWPVFRVDNPELIALLDLPAKDKDQHQDGKHYSWAQIQPSLSKLEKEAHRVEQVEASHRNAYERAVGKMRERLMLYARLKNTLQPDDAEHWSQEISEYEKLIPAGAAAVQAQRAGEKYDEATLNRFGGFVQMFDEMNQFEAPLVIPPAGPDKSRDKWTRTGQALLVSMRDGKVPRAVHDYAEMAAALQAGDAGAFNRVLTSYRSSLAPDFSGDCSKARHEVFFNQMQPFYAAMVIYVLAGVLAAMFWFNLAETWRRSAVWLVLLAFIIHTTGLVYRMCLEGRPPVTNLYSSAIFIGWGAVGLGLILERLHKNAIGVVVASVIGFLTLIIAHHLSFTEDTMIMMRAVLDTNFWLATHVVVVTLGYASTFMAGFLAIVYLVLGLFTTRLTTRLGPPDASGPGKSSPIGDNFGKSLARMVYGIVCFATLFSFVGTVLGGIWADQSWGRFWGWDPKENGALIIVLWNALILHLRWGGIVRERGLINCAIFGNIVTSWSWFGVNMLNIGLHSYGFMDSAFKWLMAFVFSQLCLIALGCLPLHMWKSFRATATAPTDHDAGSAAAAAAAS
jgi:cytochrome c-type biogenesis protein CcsB